MPPPDKQPETEVVPDPRTFSNKDFAKAPSNPIDTSQPTQLKPPEAKGKDIHLPLSKKELEARGDLQGLARMSNWAHQYKSELLTKCSVKHGGKQCYFPLTPVRDPRNDNNPKVAVAEDGRVGWIGVCSFDAKGHGEQVIFPPKKEDEI